MVTMVTVLNYKTEQTKLSLLYSTDYQHQTHDQRFPHQLYSLYDFCVF